MPTLLPRCECCGNRNRAVTNIGGYNVCGPCENEHYHPCCTCGSLTHRYRLREGECSGCHALNATWDARPIEFNGCIDEIGSDRRYGIELETSVCASYKTLRGHTKYGAKYDGSIDGMEFVSPILQGDQGLHATRGFCTRAKHMDFESNGDCGYHLHIDVSRNTEIQQRHIACAYAYTYPFWCRLVTDYRANDCHYCESLNWEAEKMETTYHFRRFCDRQERYAWFNVFALGTHGTFEIRLHEGTLDSRRICNWAKAHTRFADFVQDMKFFQIRNMFSVETRPMWRAVTNTWNDPALRRYFRRVALHQTGQLAEMVV